MLVAKGRRPKQGQGVRGTVQRLVAEASESRTASHWASLRPRAAGGAPGCAAPRGGGLSCLGQLSPPGPACPARELGCQRPFCLCEQSGLGARPGLTQRSVLSAPGWQGGQARSWLRARWDSSVREPVNPSPAWLNFPDFPAQSKALDSSEGLTARLLGKATAGSSPGWVVNVSVEGTRQRTLHLMLSARIPLPPVCLSRRGSFWTRFGLCVPVV